MAEGKGLLRLEVAVRDDSHEGRHENGNNALHCEEPFNLGAETDVPEIAAEGGKIGTPGGILEEIHQDKPDRKLFVFHLNWVFTELIRVLVSQMYKFFLGKSLSLRA